MLENCAWHIGQHDEVKSQSCRASMTSSSWSYGSACRCHTQAVWRTDRVAMMWKASGCIAKKVWSSVREAGLPPHTRGLCRAIDASIA